MSEFLRKFALTAALAGALGGLLYLVLMCLAEWPPFPFVFTLVACLALLGMVVGTVRFALRNGVFPVLPAHVHRDREPGMFWFSIGWTGLCGLAALALGGYAVARLLEG